MFRIESRVALCDRNKSLVDETRRGLLHTRREKGAAEKYRRDIPGNVVVRAGQSPVMYWLTPCATSRRLIHSPFMRVAVRANNTSIVDAPWWRDWPMLFTTLRGSDSWKATNVGRNWCKSALKHSCRRSDSGQSESQRPLLATYPGYVKLAPWFCSSVVLIRAAAFFRRLHREGVLLYL